MANKEELLVRLKEEKPAMEVRDLSFAYGENQILKDISLMIKEGKITTIMGSISPWKEHQEFKTK